MIRKKITILISFMFFAGNLFSQNLIEFVVEKTDGNQNTFFKKQGCTPDVGALVFFAPFSDLKFEMPDNPKRLKNVSAFDEKCKCYVLCVQPTDSTPGGFSKYSIDIIGDKYKPLLAFPVSNIMPGKKQYFDIKQKSDLAEQLLQAQKYIQSLQNELAQLKNKENPQYAEKQEDINKIINSMETAIKQSQPKIEENNGNRKLLTITGAVVDKYGDLIGASISVKGTSHGTVSDINGKFSLSNVPEDATLVFRYIGYKTLEIPVNKQTTINVVMKDRTFFSGYHRRIGIGATLPNLLFYDIKGIPDLINPDKSTGLQEPVSKMVSAGLALQFPLPYRLSLDLDAVFSIYNYTDKSTNEDGKIYQRLKYYAIEVPTAFVWNLGDDIIGEDLGIKFGIQNNFHFGSKYDNYLLDYHFKSKDNPIIKPYTVDALIGFVFEGGIFSASLTYTRSITNRYNQDFVQNINGADIYPLKNRKFERNLISFGYTLYINRL